MDYDAFAVLVTNVAVARFAAHIETAVHKRVAVVFLARRLVDVCERRVKTAQTQEYRCRKERSRNGECYKCFLFALRNVFPSGVAVVFKRTYKPVKVAVLYNVP